MGDSTGIPYEYCELEAMGYPMAFCTNGGQTSLGVNDGFVVSCFCKASIPFEVLGFVSITRGCIACTGFTCKLIKHETKEEQNAN